MNDLVEEFTIEAMESINELDISLIELVKTPEKRELLNQAFRAFHTIKGACGFIHLQRLEKVAHAGESALNVLRTGKQPITSDTVNTILKCVDLIKLILQSLEATGKEPKGDERTLIRKLKQLQHHPVASLAPSSVSQVQFSGEREQATPSIRVAVPLLEELVMVASELLLTRNQLLQLGKREEYKAFDIPLQRLNKLTSQLQDTTMKTRLQPISKACSTIWPRLLPRT